MKITFIIVIFVWFNSICLGDVVTTRDGNSYEGDITEVSIATLDGDILTFNRDDIVSIEIGQESGETEEVQEEEVLKEQEEVPVEEKAEEETREAEIEKDEETIEPKKEEPLIIKPTIKGMDEDRYKTY